MQWVYLAIACFVFVLAIVFLLTTIPEVTDADMAFQAEETHAGEGDLPFRKQYRLFHASFAQFCYAGAQVAIARYAHAAPSAPFPSLRPFPSSFFPTARLPPLSHFVFSSPQTSTLTCA